MNPRLKVVNNMILVALEPRRGFGGVEHWQRCSTGSEGGRSGWEEVFATGFTSRGVWFCKYNTAHVYTSKPERNEAKKEYKMNWEGCYIINMLYSQPGQGRLYFDATRKVSIWEIFESLRSLSLPTNALLTPPQYVRGK